MTHHSPSATRSASLREWWRRKYEREGIPQRWQRIVELRAAGRTQETIAFDLGITQCRVSQILQKIARRAA